MYQTKYHKAASFDDAVAALGAAEDGKYLAGGQTLLATMKQRLAAPTDLVDLRGIDGMVGISVDGDSVTIGAATTHAEVASNAALRAVIPVLCDLAVLIGDPAVRHMGTIGGSLANNDPAADYPAAVLGLNGTVITNQREIPADEYFEGLFTTALDEGEIIKAVRFPKPRRAAYQKFPNPASRFALVGVLVADTGDGPRVAVTGAGSDGVFRAEALEEALAGGFSAASLEGASVDSDGLMGDIHATPEYRAHLIGVLARRGVAAAG
ncbi:xanthine dehydrogenase family protein subunit M [Paracoccus sp. M683]|uniref:FAD binding domain-containing protein n=1 Tax=Paracoccus sp. M683 TaxID=2594268 RepID=UPI00117EE0E7|nr:xanthine dehydrogenase family protein subunit M [Paracoccus sp. M683]TRW98273.1 xanthine dehydrogenase family protein subunit M [Paracoccus sp. M683]